MNLPTREVLVSISRAVLITLVAWATVGCDDSATTADVIVASVDASVEPSAPSARADSEGEFQWVVSFTVNLEETAGTAATIQSINAAVVESAGGIEIVSDDSEVFQVHVDSTTNRIEANGTASIGIEIEYTLPAGGSEAIVNLTLSIVDDNDVEVGGNFQVLVK